MSRSPQLSLFRIEWIDSDHEQGGDLHEGCYGATIPALTISKAIQEAFRRWKKKPPSKDYENIPYLRVKVLVKAST